MFREMDIYVSSARGQKTNTSYPFASHIASLEDMKKAAEFDHVCARYADGENNKGRLIKAYRNKKTFQSTNCLPMDCDNTNPNPLAPDLTEEEWNTPQDVADAFPDVPFYVVYSRNHMKVKDGKAARPKFHVYFPIEEMTSREQYEKLKGEVLKLFPAFDDNCTDSARFFFGVENPIVEYFGGSTLINDFVIRKNYLPETIPSGERNATLLSYAERSLKRFGDGEKAYELFLLAVDRCDTPLDDEELKRIWENAVRYYHDEIESDPGYLLPEEFGAEMEQKMVTSDDIRAALQKMGITVRLNVITGQVEINGMPKKYSRSNAPNTLPTLITDYFSKRHIHVARQTIDDCLVLIEDEHRFNPVEEMLLSTSYDGADRIPELCSILGISTDAEILYLTKWLHQCVAMALNDDSEPYGADGVLVLQAPQGTGKTLFFATLAMKSDWFAEGVSIDLDNKDSIIQGTSRWISELGELDSTLKREQSALKAFFTSSKDTYRQPYAKVAVNKPRRTSFCATVNPKEFLNDETGSRRFWVIQPTKIDVERLKTLDKEWLKQLWAQVYYTLYLPKPQGYRLTEEERKRLQKDNEQFSKPLPGEIEIMDMLDWNADPEKWGWVRISSVQNNLGLKYLNSGQIGRVLTKLSDRDERIKTKAPGNVKMYLLPPRRIGEFYTLMDEDDSFLA